MSASSLIPFKRVHYLFKPSNMLEEVYSHKAKLGSVISQSQKNRFVLPCSSLGLHREGLSQLSSLISRLVS